MDASLLDPVSATVIGDLVAAGLLSLTQGVRDRLVAPGAREESAERAYAETIAARLNAVFVDHAVAGGQPIALRRFCASPEMLTSARLVAAAVLGGTIEASRPDLPARVAFLARMRLHVSVALADTLAEVFVADLQEVYERAANKRSGVSRRKNDAAIQSAELIASQMARIELILSAKELDLSSLDDRCRQLRVSVHERTRLIGSPGFLSSGKVPLDAIYVESPLAPHGRAYRDASEALGWTEAPGAEEVLRGSLRTVITGDPGAGKSTVCQALAHAATRPTSDTTILEAPIPLIIPVRDMADSDIDIVQFLADMCRKRLHVVLTVEEIQFLLRAGTVALYFDALDELNDPRTRGRCVQDIEVFSVQHPTVQILATSRMVGYQLAALDSAMFSHWHISPFSETRIESYARKWFSLEATAEVAAPLRSPADSTDVFMKDSAKIPDLRSNPLVLSLLCNLYQQDGYLPKNRPQVYERCARLLFEQWDRSRALETPLLYEEDLRDVLMHLAEWMFTNQDRSVGVPFSTLIAEVADYLHRTRYGDRREAERAARVFVEFATGRAWIFTDLGTTLDENVYQFAHRTFLEYFAACQLVRLNPTAAQLWHVLAPMVASEQWEVMAPLAVQILNVTQDRGADLLLDRALRSINRTGGTPRPAQAEVTAFIMRFLEYVSVSPVAMKNLADVQSSLLRQGVALHAEILTGWKWMSAENRREYSRTLLSSIVADLQDGRPVSVQALVIVLALPDVSAPDETDDHVVRLSGAVRERIAEGAVVVWRKQVAKIAMQWSRGLITWEEYCQEQVELGHDLLMTSSDLRISTLEAPAAGPTLQRWD